MAGTDDQDAPRTAVAGPGSAGAPAMPLGDPPTQEFRPIVTTDAEAMMNPAAVLGASWRVKLFGSKAYFRLWLAQLGGSMGDWLGFLAITAIAADLGRSNEAASIGVVMVARIGPGFFFSQLAGVLVDRLDRKKVMVTCDAVRAGTLCLLPFLNAVWQLVLISLVIELATLLWAPAKDASVPNLVPPDHLTTVNSLSLAAAYGTFPIAALMFALLAKLAEWIGHYDVLAVLKLTKTSLAVYLDALSFLASALVVWSLPLPHRKRGSTRAPGTKGRRVDFGQVFHELREGWEFIFVSPLVRAVMLGLATGLFGGGMIVPLGQVFAKDVLDGGESAFGLLLMALGFGVGFGVLTLSVLQRRMPKAWVFNFAVFGAGFALLAAASMVKLAPAMAFVFLIGVCAGAVYVVGFTLLQESVDDALRGRIFSSLNTLVRFCLLMAFAVAPFLSSVLGGLSNRWFNGRVKLGVEIALPGVRLTLWLAGLIILFAGFIALMSLRKGSPTGRVRDLK